MAEEVKKEIEDNIEEDIEERDEITTEEPEEKYSIENDPEIQKIREYAQQIETAIKNNPRLVNRVENKHDFASEIINTNSNQKIANLEEEQIQDLLDKRSFMNFLQAYGWLELSRLIGMKISDIENYSLSKGGFLIERTMVDNIRQASTMVNVDPKNKPMKGGPNAI